ncbi:KRAB-A domain-containing protein 2-like [Palaemon carinicauda]|uniref:KRAB-A domain-containing protein 2-like n=1 Tax=Palaemon carinicauda TaxID=392227 RepID=UPI0035B5730A
MVYQCHLTKFVILRPLTSKRAAEVAFHLLDIFLLTGAPCILQSDNGSEFTAQVVQELKDLWAQWYGRTQKSKTSWLLGSLTTPPGWFLGLCFVQNQKKPSYHSGINNTLYIALLGENLNFRLTATNLHQEVIDRLEINY